MNLVLIGIIIFVIVYLLLNAFARASSKKIALILKKIAVYLSLILAALFTIGGKFLFSLPFFIKKIAKNQLNIIAKQRTDKLSKNGRSDTPRNA